MSGWGRSGCRRLASRCAARAAYRLALLLTAVGLCAHGCTDVDLQAIQPAIEPPPPPPKPSGSICAPDGTSFGAPMRVVFMVDMSTSNVGKVDTYTSNTTTTYTIVSQDPETPPSDLAGQRFSQIEQFIRGCGAGDDVAYAVMGFGKTSVLGNNTTCLSPFESAPSALQTVADLATMQRHDVELHRGTGSDPFYLQDHTYYGVALDCLANKIREDVALLGDERPIYQVFFLSDGAPDDPPATTSYAQRLAEIQQTVAEGASGFVFHPVLYYNGQAEGSSDPPADAKARLDEMVHAVDPSVDTLLLGDLGGQESAFCQVLKPRARVSYELTSLYAVNLNAVVRGNSLLPDSSASGLADEEKTARGFDPANARSTGVLDRLCTALADTPQACQDEVTRTGCDASKAVALGLTACDVRIAQEVYGAPLTGADTDGDRIPDVIEILRGTSPVRADALDMPFADGLSQLQKITAGLDVAANAALYPVGKDAQMDVTFEPAQGGCDAEHAGYTYVFEHLPLSATAAYTDDTSEAFSLTHAAGENVIVLFSLWQATGGIRLSHALYAQKMVVRPNAVSVELSAPVPLGGGF